jgi:hypothetical protein
MKLNDKLGVIVAIALKHKVVPALFGDPGIGKSSWLEALADKEGTKCFTVACNQLGDKTDLTGARTVPANKTQTDWKQVFFPHADIYDAITYAEAHPQENPKLLLDEYNRTTADVTSAVLSIITTKTIGNKRIPKNLDILIAGNDKGNIASLDEASISRTLVLDVEADTPTFLALHQDLHPVLREVLTANPDYIFGRHSELLASMNQSEEDGEFITDEIYGMDSTIDQITTPRTIKYLSDILNNMPTDLLNALMSTTVTLKRYPDVVCSELDEIIFGAVGYTKFSDEVTKRFPAYMASLSGSNQQTNQGVLIPRPPIVDALRALSSYSDIEKEVSALDHRAKSILLQFALADTEDNKDIIKACMSTIEEIDENGYSIIIHPEVAKNLLNVAVGGLFDKDNFDFARSFKNPAGNYFRNLPTA